MSIDLVADERLGRVMPHSAYFIIMVVFLFLVGPHIEVEQMFPRYRMKFLAGSLYKIEHKIRLPEQIRLATSGTTSTAIGVVALSFN